MLPRATSFASNGNNIVTQNFTRFATSYTIDDKGRRLPLEMERIASGNNKI